jgi:crotonobetainyl-CoA:carnitine CoA-transferase CaiB-like acyl-CoA transferase
VLLGLDDLVDDPRFDTNAQRVANRSELTSLLNARLSRATKQEWFERLTEAGIPAGPVNDIAEVFANPQVDVLGTVRAVDHAALRDCGSSGRRSRSAASRYRSEVRRPSSVSTRKTRWWRRGWTRRRCARSSTGEWQLSDR